MKASKVWQGQLIPIKEANRPSALSFLCHSKETFQSHHEQIVHPALRHTASSDLRRDSNLGLISLDLSFLFWCGSRPVFPVWYFGGSIGQTGTQEQTKS
ncbi:hypothetical protein CEXT_711811 [Caerostris extrusa]|uniref:Uncharacterized protein n=1 Tax=Caerostris extrusa TaxID=172846 RepID=A0AAV4RQL8_CAEEX|nr:hypothetical protein CEXT_711811 [Caerostris extrusa]